MLTLNKRFDVVNTVHDEVWLLVNDDEVDAAKNYMEQVMSTAPSWCADLPLACEVGVGDSYGSCK
jgi:DNA polymerase I-like protein with 3'-5' exonuclease and polymerase domains